MWYKKTFKTLMTFCLCLLFISYTESSELQILSLVPAGIGASSNQHGSVFLNSGIKSKVRLVGTGLGNSSSGGKVLLTPAKAKCTGGKTTKAFDVKVIDDNNAVFDIELDDVEVGHDPLYLCLNFDGNWKHLGTQAWLSLHVSEKEVSFLPIWIQIAIITVLLILSGLFSGLNLGLMSLDQTELSIIQKVGSATEKKHAKQIFPLRKRGNFLLCTLLLGNVMVNSSFTILFDNLTNGFIAIISSTIGIVLFGEIIPQAICSRHGLAVGAKTLWITKFFMVVTFPVSFPVSLILDKVLGEEMGQVYNKEKLQELIRMTADQRLLHDNEANIMSGVLQLTDKRVEDVMTKIEDVYMLELDTVLDFETLTEIMSRGYTRVPVYEKNVTDIVNLLNTKELALIDPDDKTQLRTVCRFYDHKPLYVEMEMRLDAMLQEFLQGNCHMAIVQKLHNTENKDPYYENIGVITLEDVIEEILQSEIIDETDRMTDNRQKKPLSQVIDYNLYPSDHVKSKLPRQLEFVAFQFLSSNVEPFSETYLKRNVLKNLMKKNIVINLTPTTPISDKNFIFRKGQPADKFVLILQGTVEVTIGSENLTFETGPFSHFGSECLNSLKRMTVSVQDLRRLKEYVPDYSVRALTPVQYLCIEKYHYMAALRTSTMLRTQWQSVDEKKVDDHFDMELAKLVTNKDNSNCYVADNTHIANLALEALKDDDSPKKRSTSSLDKLMHLNRKQDSLTRKKRSGSDTREPTLDCSPDRDSFGRRKRTSQSSGAEQSDDVGHDKDAGDSAVRSPPLVSQTSFPFTPHQQLEDPVDIMDSAKPWPRMDDVHSGTMDNETSNNGRAALAEDMAAGADALENVPLVEVKPPLPNTGSENPGLAKNYAPLSQKEKVPLMSHSDGAHIRLKESKPS